VDASFVEDFGSRWQDAVNRQAIDEIQAFCADDMRFTDPGLTGLVDGFAGKADLRPLFERIYRAFPDIHFTRPDPGYFVPAEGDFGIARWASVATMTGPFDPPGFAPTHDTVKMRGVDVWQFRDGLLVNWEGFYDSLETMQQTGVLPPTGGGAERVLARLQHLGAWRRRRATRHTA
jgi:steroid delta-isomerase-like uncharacterized protein